MARQQSVDNINHLGSVRIRVKGSGNLKIKAYSLDFINESQLPNIGMAVGTNKVETVLADFKEQKMQLEIGTTEENEYFVLSRVIPYLRPIATEYPQ